MKFRQRQEDSRIKAIDEALPWLGLILVMMSAAIGPVVSTLIPSVGIACVVVGVYRNCRRLVVRACFEWRLKKQNKKRIVFSYYE